MPNTIFDHQTCREKTCVLCFNKPKRKKVISERVKDLIESMALPSYKQYCDLPTLPNVICDACLKKLERGQMGTKVALTVPMLSKVLGDEMLTGPI